MSYLGLYLAHRPLKMGWKMSFRSIGYIIILFCDKFQGLFWGRFVAFFTLPTDCGKNPCEKSAIPGIN